MAYISTIRLEGDLNIKDETAREMIGDLEQLGTEENGNLVAAVNELLNTSVGSSYVEQKIREHSEADSQSHPDIRQHLDALDQRFGDLEQLETEDKSSLVAAVNEVLGKAGTGGSGGNADQSGMSEELKTALVNYYTHVMPNFDDTNGLAYINAILTALGAETRGESGGEETPDEPVAPDGPEVTLSSITATYSGGDVAVGTAVTDLTGIVVTAHYSDGTSEAVTGYTLSGTIAEGSNTITVSYGGKTTTFMVTGVAESGGEDEPTAFGVSEISAKSVKRNGAIISATGSEEFNKGFKYGGIIVSINVEAGKTYMLMFMDSNLTSTMGSYLFKGQSPIDSEPMAVNLNEDGTLGDANTAFNPTFVSLANVDPYKTTGMIVTGKRVFWSGSYNAFDQKVGTSFVEAVNGTDHAWCVCIFTANIDFCGIVQTSNFSLLDENYFRIYEVDPNTEYNPYLDGVIGIGEER